MARARGAGVIAVVLVSCLVSGCAGATQGARPTIAHTPVDLASPSAPSCTRGLPVMSGFYFDKKNVSHGFIYNGRKFITINDPNATTVKRWAGTSVYGMDDKGTVGGSYNDSKGASQGFIYQAGKFTTINDPNAGTAAGQGTYVWGMNDQGIISGWFEDADNVVHGFEDVADRFTTFNDPHAGTKDAPGNYLESSNLDTEMFAFNNRGVLYGEYIDSKGVAHGAEEVAGHYTTIDYPRAVNSSGAGSVINDVNTFKDPNAGTGGTIPQGMPYSLCP
jgi:hypothetical protein